MPDAPTFGRYAEIPYDPMTPEHAPNGPITLASFGLCTKILFGPPRGKKASRADDAVDKSIPGSASARNWRPLRASVTLPARFDGLSAGGRWIRTIGSAGGAR